MMGKYIGILFSLITFSFLEANIFDQDDRQPMTSSRYPWSTIGKIFSSKNSCTGTLVGKNLVATAAHCVFDDNQELLPNLKFFPNYKNGKGQYFSGIHKIWYGTRDPKWGTPAEKTLGKLDWAILQLNSPLGDYFGFMGLEDIHSPYGYKVNLAGYASDFENTNTAGVHLGCAIRGERNGYFIHDCDSNKGASGGPLFNNDNQLVGINAAGVADTTTFELSKGNIAVKVAGFKHIVEELRDNEESPTDTYFISCNNTYDDLHMSYSYFYHNSWHTKGWIKIKAQSCSELSVPGKYYGEVYFYAESNSHKWNAGSSTPFCVNKQKPFIYAQADQMSCNLSTQKKVPFAGPYSLNFNQLFTHNFDY